MSVNNLSKRLAAIGALVPEADTMADIGTDHALLPIHLVQSGVVERAIAMDINEGPLARAREAVRKAGLENRIETRLSDGFAALKKGEADCAVIAGMGGDLTIRILTDGMEVVRALQEIICAPQSEIARVRAFAREQGFEIDAEDMVLEDGKYYQMFRLRRCAGNPEKHGCAEDESIAVSGITISMREIGDHYGRELIRQRHPVLRSFLHWERSVKEQILLQLTQNMHRDGTQALCPERTRNRIRQVRGELARNAAAMGMINGTDQDVMLR